MNPLAMLFVVLGVLMIIIAIKGSYKDIGASIKKI
jgi:hypothetical protein